MGVVRPGRDRRPVQRRRGLPIPPVDSGFVGRDAIVKAWLEPSGEASTRDEPGTWDAHYEPFSVAGDRAVAVGWSRYYTDASRSTVANVWDNVYLLEFDADGRCCLFTEYYVERPRDRIQSASTGT